MTKPTSTPAFLWPKIKDLCDERKTIYSLTGRSYHTMESYSHDSPHMGNRNTYVIRYKSGSPKTIKFSEICELYDLLWQRAREINPPHDLTSKEMGDGLYKKMFNRSWNRPGSAMLAILPKLDNRIEVILRPAGIRLIDKK